MRNVLCKFSNPVLLLIAAASEADSVMQWPSNPC